MKKIVFIVMVMFFSVNVVNADLIEVEFKKCVDGDTATLVIDGEDKKVRFLAVDTPETVHPTKGEEDGGKTASDFTCNSLKNATKIEIEYDEKSDKVDKYNRELVWLYIDDVLFQETLIKEGYAEVAYIYGDYKYVESLCKIQASAVKDKLGIWYDGKREVGYCNANNKKNTTTKKTTTTKKDKDLIKLIEKEQYEEVFIILLEDYSLLSAVVILIIIVVIVKLKKKL